MPSIYSITCVHNPDFRKLLSWYGIEPADYAAGSYHNCSGWPDQQLYYQADRLLSLPGVTFGDRNDRTGTLHLPFQPEASEFLAPTPVGDLQQVIDSRAEGLSIVGGGELSVLWSGGIDSTAVVCAMLRVMPAGSITVGYTAASIDENPEFFLWMGRQGLQLVNISITDLDELPHPVVSGGGGDHLVPLYESDLALALDLDQDWKSVVLGRGARPELVEFLERLVSASPFEVHSYFDLKKFHTLNSKWDWTDRFCVHYCQGLSPGRTHAFFYGQAFESWIIENQDIRVGDGVVGLKWQLKDYIYSVWPNAEFRATATKKASQDLWRTKYLKDGVVRHPTFFVDDSGHRVGNLGDRVMDHDEFRQIYGDRYDHCFGR